MPDGDKTQQQNPLSALNLPRLRPTRRTASGDSKGSHPLRDGQDRDRRSKSTRQGSGQALSSIFRFTQTLLPPRDRHSHRGSRSPMPRQDGNGTNSASPPTISRGPRHSEPVDRHRHTSPLPTRPSRFTAAKPQADLPDLNHPSRYSSGDRSTRIQGSSFRTGMPTRLDSHSASRYGTADPSSADRRSLPLQFNSRRERTTASPGAPTRRTGRTRRGRSPLRALDLLPSMPPRETATPSRPPIRVASPILYGTRLLILGVGIGVIAGTLLSVWDPARHFVAGASSNATVQQTSQTKSEPTKSTASNSLKFTQEMTGLKNQVQTLISQQPGLIPTALFVDLDNGAYLDVNGGTTIAAASTIKIPVLVAFLQDVDAGKIRLDEMLTMKKELIGSGSGELQYQAPGSQFSALETATKMIIISDNTATNMLIDRLGGIAALNQRFQSWGLQATVIRNALPDLEGTNTTSPRDMVSLMGMVSQGDLLSLRSRDRMLEIMRRTVTNTLLPQGLGEGAVIAHKTGDIGSVVGDIGLIDMPSGKRYLAAILVKRPFNDSRAQELIRQISRLTYRQFSQSTSSAPTTRPSPSAALPFDPPAAPVGFTDTPDTQSIGDVRQATAN